MEPEGAAVRVLFVDDEELILKEVVSIQVGHGQILLEAVHGDKRTHIVPHSSWDNDDLAALLRERADQPVIDFEPLSRPKAGSR